MKVKSIAFVAMTAIAIVSVFINVFTAVERDAKASIKNVDSLLIQLSDTKYELSIAKQKIHIIACESSGYHHGVWGDSGKSYGIAQFQLGTFKDLRTEAGKPELKWMNKADQLWLLDWALRHGYGKRWTCFDERLMK